MTSARKTSSLSKCTSPFHLKTDVTIFNEFNEESRTSSAVHIVLKGGAAFIAASMTIIRYQSRLMNLPAQDFHQLARSLAVFPCQITALK